MEYFDKKDCVIFQSARTVAHLCKSRGCDLPLFKSLTVAPHSPPFPPGGSRQQPAFSPPLSPQPHNPHHPETTTRQFITKPNIY